MEKLTFHLEKSYGKFKILNATNGGPFHKRHTKDQWRTNFQEYKAARIPYSRNHDSNLSGSIYGGPYAHDISAIFPNFDADENDAQNYVFENTDECILATLEAGTKTFFRLGQSIEHQIRKMHVFPPKDYLKWSKICEHIIRHYTEGWANGFTLDMPYWEIWNEPDLDPEASTNKRCWAGTYAEFFDFYEVVAKHLKSCFPHLKIGGPALAYNEFFGEDFLCEMQKRNVPIDFFSWHVYAVEPNKIVEMSKRMRALMEKYGYHKAESILNEWNYVKGWTEEFVYSLESIHGIKGAAFIMSVMSEAQKSSIDMLMYYGTRPSSFNGVFDYYTYRPLKGYYPFKWYGGFYDLEYEVRAENDVKDIYTICGVDKEGKATAIVTHYSDDDAKAPTQVCVELKKDAEYDVYLLDKDHNGEWIKTTKDLTFEMPVHSCIMIREK